MNRILAAIALVCAASSVAFAQIAGIGVPPAMLNANPAMVAAPAWIQWLLSNRSWLEPLFAPMLIALLANIINGLKKYGDGVSPVTAFLHSLIDRLSVVANRDGAGTFKMLGTRSQPLANGVSKGSALSASVFLPIILIPLFIGTMGAGAPKCSAQQKAQWKAAGIDTAQCLAPAVMSAASDAIVQALSQAAGQPTDFKAFGIQLAKTYGPVAAICAVGKIWADLAGSPVAVGGLAGAELDSNAIRIDWLIHHQGEWLLAAVK